MLACCLHLRFDCLEKRGGGFGAAAPLDPLRAGGTRGVLDLAITYPTYVCTLKYCFITMFFNSISIFCFICVFDITPADCYMRATVILVTQAV